MPLYSPKPATHPHMRRFLDAFIVGPAAVVVVALLVLRVIGVAQAQAPRLSALHEENGQVVINAFVVPLITPADGLRYWYVEVAEDLAGQGFRKSMDASVSITWRGMTAYYDEHLARSIADYITTTPDMRGILPEHELRIAAQHVFGQQGYALHAVRVFDGTRHTSQGVIHDPAEGVAAVAMLRWLDTLAALAKVIAWAAFIVDILAAVHAFLKSRLE